MYEIRSENVSSPTMCDTQLQKVINKHALVLHPVGTGTVVSDRISINTAQINERSHAAIWHARSPDLVKHIGIPSFLRQHRVYSSCVCCQAEEYPVWGKSRILQLYPCRNGSDQGLYCLHRCSRIFGFCLLTHPADSDTIRWWCRYRGCRYSRYSW